MYGARSRFMKPGIFLKLPFGKPKEDTTSRALRVVEMIKVKLNSAICELG
jgi:hypothetical protein